MKEIRTAPQMRSWTRAQRAEGATVAFVPTMGALHEGHLSLATLAAEKADRVIVSIFLNPTQFGPDEDLGSYPRDLAGDIARLQERGVDAVFIPSETEIYPPGASTWVVETDRSARLEGIARPGHYRGVTTVVAKLLTIVEPDFLVLGQKDAQQVAVISRMVSDLLLPVEVVVGRTVRESDGLALSSRNAYLSGAERRQATCLFEALQLALRMVAEGEDSPEVVLDAMQKLIVEQPAARIDYLAAVAPESFEPVGNLSDGALFCVAVYIGTTRLIDNELAVREG